MSLQGGPTERVVILCLVCVILAELVVVALAFVR